MIRINEAPVQVNTPNGKGFIEDIIVTSLGHLQIRVKFPGDPIDDCATFIKYTVGNFDKLLEGSELSISNLERVEENA
jgi:hypothetical protein